MTTISKLDAIPLAIDSAEIASAFAPFVVHESGPDDVRWLAEVNRRKQAMQRKLRRRGWWGFLRRFRREKSAIEREYGEVWSRIVIENYDVHRPVAKAGAWEWRERAYLASNIGGARVKLLLAMKTIEALQPQSVLEVGSGNGANLLFLSGRFPQTRFAGLELTEQGVKCGRDFQSAYDRFPAELAEYSPQPQRDDTAFKRIEFHQGSAQSLPFADGSFDLVLTVLAVEQMESIRADALREISRVAKKHVLMIEPFADLNDKGLRRQYIESKDYLRARIDELPRYGLEPQWATADFPQKVLMAATCVLSRKR